MVEWEPVEITEESLSLIAADDPVHMPRNMTYYILMAGQGLET